MSTIARWEMLIDSFLAVAESGAAFQIRLYQEFIGKIDGEKRAITAEGYRCKIINDDTFEIIDFEIVVRRVK